MIALEISLLMKGLWLDRIYRLFREHAYQKFMYK